MRWRRSRDGLAGNALFLFELIEGVRATGSIDLLPDSIESMIAGEIDRLTPSDRTILRYAAVLGASFDPELLAHAVGDDVDLDDGLWTRLAGLVSHETSGALRFRNTLIRDAAYEGLPYRRRRVLHDRVGQTIELEAGISLDEEVGTLALHYFEAQRWDKAWVSAAVPPTARSTSSRMSKPFERTKRPSWPAAACGASLGGTRRDPRAYRRRPLQPEPGRACGCRSTRRPDT